MVGNDFADGSNDRVAELGWGARPAERARLLVLRFRRGEEVSGEVGVPMGV